MNATRPLAVLAPLTLAALAQAQTTLTTVRVCNGLTQPLFATHAPGDSTRLFVLERTGRVKIVNLVTGQVNPTPFLDVSGQIATAWLEYGLLGLAFHPDYANNGIFYVNFTPPNGQIADTQVARYHVSANPNIADPSSAATILRFGFGTRREHRAGWMGFGPDGYLYISTGDGGESDPDNAAQNLTLLRGKMLRLDVNGPDGVPATGDDDGFPADANKLYQIPPTNPFASSPPSAPEIWAYGLRNPWRCSFDRDTGDLWIGDVGQSSREELDFQAAGAAGGLNFGWRCTEGTVCSGLTGCTCNGPALTRPIFDYPRGVGVSVTGGYVYRGCTIPDLRGTYIYADYQVSKVFSLRYDGHTVTEARERTAELAPGGGLNLQSISSLAEDADGELYFCDYNGGELFRLAARTTPPQAVTITGQPQGGPVCQGDDLRLSVTAVGVGAPLSYRWRRNGTPLVEGARTSGVFTPALTILGVVAADAGAYDCVVTHPCKSLTSNPAAVTVGGLCPADFNCDSFVDFFDYGGFVSAFEAGDPRADINRDGFLDFFDYDAFVELFESGC